MSPRRVSEQNRVIRVVLFVKVAIFQNFRCCNKSSKLVSKFHRHELTLLSKRKTIYAQPRCVIDVASYSKNRRENETDDIGLD